MFKATLGSMSPCSRSHQVQGHTKVKHRIISRGNYHNRHQHAGEYARLTALCLKLSLVKLHWNSCWSAADVAAADDDDYDCKCRPWGRESGSVGLPSAGADRLRHHQVLLLPQVAITSGAGVLYRPPSLY